MNTINNEEYDEIDLLEILRALKKKFLVILLCAIIGGCIATGYVFFLATPMYESTAKLYIKTQTTSITSLADIQLGSQLAYDYQEMVVSRAFIGELIQNLNLDYSYKEIAENMVTVENPTNTRILNISIKSDDPEEAKSMANELAMISKKNISNIMATDEPVLYERAIKTSKPESPKKKRDIAIGFILGMFLSIVIITIKFISNDTIKDMDDVERYMKLPVLATIPRDEHSTNKKKEIEKSKRKRSR